MEAKARGFRLTLQLQVHSLEIALEAESEIKKKDNKFAMKERFIVKTDIKAFCYSKVVIKKSVSLQLTKQLDFRIKKSIPS
jgi:hypothetical protein